MGDTEIEPVSLALRRYWSTPADPAFELRILDRTPPTILVRGKGGGREREVRAAPIVVDAAVDDAAAVAAVLALAAAGGPAARWWPRS